MPALIRRADGASIDSLDQGAMGLAAKSVRVDGRHVAIVLAAPVADFAGDLDDAGQVLSGQWHQGGTTGLKAGGNRDVTTRELPGLNHLFQTARTGAPSEYAAIDETRSPAALTLIGDWILAHAKWQHRAPRQNS